MLATMNKYASDANPLGHATGGTNLADVCLHGKMAGEATNVTVLQATVERLEKERAEGLLHRGRSDPRNRWFSRDAPFRARLWQAPTPHPASPDVAT